MSNDTRSHPMTAETSNARVDVTWPLSILEAGNWREVYMGTKHMRLEVSYPYEAWERLMAALAAAQQQPAEGEEIMVNTPYDVFTLPLHPSGLPSGPRFVVHVPGPEQQPKARGVVDGCHCATCTCNPGMTPAIRFDTSPAAQEGAVRDHLIALGWTPPGSQQPAAEGANVAHATAALQAEVEALRAEVERLNRLLGRIVEGDGDSTLTIRAGTDAFAAAREYLSAPKAAPYNRKRIAWELERTAMGDGYYGSALRAAKEFPEATPSVRALLDRWATGKEGGLSDRTDLCAFALQIYMSELEKENE